MGPNGKPWPTILVFAILATFSGALAVAAYVSWRDGDAKGAAVLAALAALVALPPSWDSAVRLKEWTATRDAR